MIVRRAWPLLALLAACATSAAPPQPGPASGGPSAITAEDRDAVETLNEAMGVQGRHLYAAQAAPAPDCARVCLLVGNICALAEKVCVVAARYPASDPVAADCLDARSRCQHAREAGSGCACRQGL